MDQNYLKALQEIARNVAGVPTWIQITLGILNLVILAWTLYKLIEYTSATKGLLDASYRQHITEIRPFLRLQKANPLVLVNEGRGIAVNIHLKYINGKDELKLVSVPAMAAGTSQTNNIVHDTSVRDFNPETNPYSVEAEYEDIEHNKYGALFVADYTFNDRFRIEKQEPLDK